MPWIEIEWPLKLSERFIQGLERSEVLGEDKWGEGWVRFPPEHWPWLYEVVGRHIAGAEADIRAAADETHAMSEALAESPQEIVTQPVDYTRRGEPINATLPDDDEPQALWSVPDGPVFRIGIPRALGAKGVRAIWGDGQPHLMPLRITRQWWVEVYRALGANCRARGMQEQFREASLAMTEALAFVEDPDTVMIEALERQAKGGAA